MKKVCVLIRVFDRIEDLLYNLQIIKKTWISFNYTIVVVFNGKQSGYNLPDEVYNWADNIVILGNNAGHLKGNSQLLLEGIRNINLSSFDYTIILEADTWLYSDQLIVKYVQLLSRTDAVWASARWYDKYYSLATDFAIIKTDFIRNNVEIFDFVTYPECYVCNYLIERNKKYIWIKENMNVHTPSYIKHLPFAPMGRFFVFPLSRMVTHHIELLKGNMKTKKRHFNIVARYNFFEDVRCPIMYLYIMNLLMRVVHLLDKCLLRRSWYSQRKVCRF